jgi:hypothetical protein
VLVLALRDDLRAPYEDYPTWLLLAFGWLLVVALPLAGFLVARLPWRAGTHLAGPPPGSDPRRAAARCGVQHPTGDPARPGRLAMSTEAIVMMVVAMVVIWGGLALAIASLLRHGAVEDRAEGVPRER